MERTKDLADDAGLDVINTQDLPERLEQDRLLGRGLWRVDIVEGTFDLDSRMDGTTKDPLDSCEGLPPQFCPLASPLTKGSGFDNTPTAISSWRDYYKAKSMDIAFPAPLLMSNALTLFHAISHLFPRPSSQSSSPRPMSFAPGSHICIHIIQATQSQVELAPYYQLLAPLFPYVTIDIFLIGPGVVVVPLASGMNVKGPLDTPTVLAKRDHSIEYKAEAFGSCIRVHFARARYEEFPRSNYPPHIIVCQDAAARLFLRPEGEEGQTVGEEDLKAAEATVAAVFRMEGVRVLFAESTELDAAIVRERIRVRGGKSSSVEVGVNPFRQTLRRHMPTLRIPAYLNGYLVTCVV
ncbi:hypothetical protein HK104_009909 [Borealophlyctis nickersoniae]|nr:hypothetical protein HK104_009909 [Borealophlyctis nickersoniae]